MLLNPLIFTNFGRFSQFPMKRLQILLIPLLLSLSFTAGAQSLAVKTNALYWATATPNVGLEYAVAPRWTIGIGGGYNPWTFDKEKKEMAAYLVGKLFDVKLVSGSKEKEMAKEFSGEKLLGLREDAAEEIVEAPHISEKRSSKARVRVELFPLLHCRIKG